MKKYYILICGLFLLHFSTIAQRKTIIGVVAFTNSDESGNSEMRSNHADHSQQDKYTAIIQEAVENTFVNTKRFTLVERDKMDQINAEKKLEKGDAYIDNSVIQQSAALGAQYLVLGSISKANEGMDPRYAAAMGYSNSPHAEIAFNLRVVDVATGEVVASNTFNATEKGKTAFDKALDVIRPDVEDFIRKNFKLILTLAQVEKKDSSGAATKVLIAGGSSLGMKVSTSFKVYEVSEIEVDGKKIERKLPLGKVTVTDIPDENFSECIVNEGGAAIASKLASGSKIKCEMIIE